MGSRCGKISGVGGAAEAGQRATDNASDIIPADFEILDYLNMRLSTVKPFRVPLGQTAVYPNGFKRFRG